MAESHRWNIIYKGSVCMILKVTAIGIGLTLMRFIAQDLYMRKHNNGENKYFEEDLNVTAIIVAVFGVIGLISHMSYGG